MFSVPVFRPVSSGPPPFPIARALRFRQAVGGNLTRTFQAGGSIQKYTWSVWLKRGLLGQTINLASVPAFTSPDQKDMRFNTGNDFIFLIQISSATSCYIDFGNPVKVFKDPSAWFHFCLVLDTPNATSTDRLRGYINGVRMTTGVSTVMPALNSSQTGYNSAVAHNIGGTSPQGGANWDGYMADFYFIDNQSLTAASFGEVSATTGQWVPKAYAGTYGVTGFHLKFDNNSTINNLGLDSSGLGNNWTPVNMSVTAGSTNDSVTDTPSNNHSTINLLSGAASNVLSAANLEGVNSTVSTSIGCSSEIPSGKWYWECTAGTGMSIGIYDVNGPRFPTTTYLGSNSSGYGYANDGQKANAGSFTVYGVSYNTGDVIGVAYDAAVGTLAFYKNNAPQGNAFLGLTGIFTPALRLANAGTLKLNFGQQGFVYTPPSGYLALSQANFPNDNVAVAGNFTGNAAADGPFVYMNGYPTTLTINGNVVTFGTHADRLANGFKIRTASASYNVAGSNSWTATIVSNTVNRFKTANAQINP